MNFGGKDISLLGRDLDDDVEVVARYFFQFWPDMIVEQEGVSDACRYDASQEPLENCSWTYLYKDMAAYEEVERVGVTEELDNAMVSVHHDGSEVMIVVGLEWDYAPLIAHFYRTADEQADPTA